MCDRPTVGQERGEWQGMEDSLGAFSLTCTHKNQWVLLKCIFSVWLLCVPCTCDRA